jgi:RecB family exonuclease
MPTIVTRDGLYELLHERLPGAPRRLSPFERDSLAQAAAQAAARALETDGVGSDEPRAAPLPFRVRPGLVAEMLRFYDQLRRQSQRLERFSELIEEALGGGAGDRGADRLLTQTRFLTTAFREYERRAADSGGWDEHMLRERLMRDPVVPAIHDVIVTAADWIAEPDGLYIGDFDLFARMPALRRLDLVCTEQVLGSGFHERIHAWWPGLDEVEAAEVFGAAERPRPLLEIPPDGEGRLWFTARDRHDELVAVAEHVRSFQRRHLDPPMLSRTAVVFKHPLPYLYLAADTLGAAGLPYEMYDARPLASEPFLAVVDLVLDALETGFSRAALVAILATPHLTMRRDASLESIHALDASLRARGYLGDLSRLEALADGWSEERSRPALDAALAVARALSPVLAAHPASLQIRAVAAFVRNRLRPLDETDPFAAREARARDVLLSLLDALAGAHAAHHDPEWTVDDLAAAVRRWIGEHTFEDEPSPGGVQLLDDRAARYGELDDITIVGLVDGDWPERQARNIFYPSGLLRALGWPSEHTRRRASDARFVDLLGSACRRVALSTIALDDEAIVMRSTELDEIPRARLSTVPSVDEAAPITVDETLATGAPTADAPAGPAHQWAELRTRRTSRSDPLYHGSIGPREPRGWSVSALELYLACPFKFYAQHVLRLEEEPEDAEVMDPRQQGQFVHRVFQLFYDRWHGSGRGSITPDVLDEARALFAKVVEDEVGKLPEGEAGLERTHLLGSSAAAGLGEAVLRMEAERPLRVVERLLEHRLDGPVTIVTSDGTRVIPLSGKADRIDLLEDGTFRLVDYKLGWPPQRSRALQLPIYSLAAEQRLAGRLGRQWTVGEAAYLAFKGPRRVVPLFPAQGDRQKVLADAQQRVAETIDAIARGEFPPAPEDVFLCESCGFAAVCRKDYVGDV